MKKILIITLVLLVGMYMFYNMNKKEDNNITNNFEEDRYMFISYIDYSYLKGKDENSLKEEIDKIVLNIKNSNFKTIQYQESFNVSIRNEPNNATISAKLTTDYVETFHIISNTQGVDINIF